MFKRTHDPRKFYICLSPWCRLVFFEKRYIGWYNPRKKKV